MPAGWGTGLQQKDEAMTDVTILKTYGISEKWKEPAEDHLFCRCIHRMCPGYANLQEQD